MRRNCDHHQASLNKNKVKKETEHQNMDQAKGVFFSRHLYKFEDVWNDKKFSIRNVNDLNGFFCCLCCIIPFGVIKASIMTVIHLIIFVPISLITTTILFPYQLFMIYVAMLSTVLLGPKIKFILFFCIWIFYIIFILIYLMIAYFSCIFFSFYASFKTSLSAQYFIFGGFIDSIHVLLINIGIYFKNNTIEFYQCSIKIKNYIINIDQGEATWDISFISCCQKMIRFLFNAMMICISVLCIMSAVFIEIIIYFVPFCIHLMLNLYFLTFLKYYFQKMIIKKPCLALMAAPFIIIPILLVPVFAALFLVFYVWLYSAFFNKAILIHAIGDDNDDDLGCLQQMSYIGNVILLYNSTLAKYCFQSCWKCHCLHGKYEKPEDDGFDDIEKRQKPTPKVIKDKKKKKKQDDDYNPYEMKFRRLCDVFWDTKHNKDLVTLGKKTESESGNVKEKQIKVNVKKNAATKELNIETYASPKVIKKKHKKNKKKKKPKSNRRSRKIRVDSDSVSYLAPKKKKLKANWKNEKAGYSSVHMSEEEETSLTRSEELGILISPSHSDKENKFSYPSGL